MSGAFTPRYSEAQKTALLRARLIDGLSAAETARRARAGLLPGVPAFEIPDSTVREIVRRDGDRFLAFAVESPGEAHALLDQGAMQLAALADLQRRKLVEAAQKGEEVKPEAVKKAADALAAARRALPPLPRTPAAQVPSPGHDQPHEAPGPGEAKHILSRLGLTGNEQPRHTKPSARTGESSARA